MNTLLEILEQRSWRELRAVSHAHGLPFNTHHAKTQARERLHRELMNGQLRRSFRALNEAERAALTALQAAGGALPLHRFMAAFGPIRPYKPWRDDAPAHPWRRPVSAAEKLWFLGFVHIYKGESGRPRQVGVPAEVLALLPPLPRPLARIRRLPRSLLTPDLLRTDVAALIGALLSERVTPRWQRWLPPHTLKAINARLRVQENVSHTRSELRTGRLRFLHYLAEAAGLVSIQNGVILPTAAAWFWLDLPSAEQWRWLWEAWTRDLSARDPVWNAYRFPPVTPEVWAALVNQLRALMPDRTYTVRSLIAALRPSVLADETLHAIPALLRGPLVWAGLITAQRQQFALTAAGHAALNGQNGAFAPPQNATLTLNDAALTVTLPAVPPVLAFAEFAAWAIPDRGVWMVDADAVSRAVEQGYDAEGIARVLGALIGAPLPRPLFDQIQAWAKQAQGLVLRQMTVLTSPDADLLARLRQDRTLRDLFAEPLSDHHAAVFPHAAETLAQRLARRGLPVTPVQTTVPPKPCADLAPEMVEYLWLAVRAYRDLAAWVPPPVRMPGAVLAWLADRLPPGHMDRLSHTAAALRDDLARTLAGYAALPAPVASDDPAAIRAAVQAAYEQHGTLTIEYFSPAYGSPTIRTIAPILPISESGGAEYVEAWCYTADAARTFRLDRILRILDG